MGSVMRKIKNVFDPDDAESTKSGSKSGLSRKASKRQESGVPSSQSSQSLSSKSGQASRASSVGLSDAKPLASDPRNPPQTPIYVASMPANTSSYPGKTDSSKEGLYSLSSTDPQNEKSVPATEEELAARQAGSTTAAAGGANASAYNPYQNSPKYNPYENATSGTSEQKNVSKANAPAAEYSSLDPRTQSQSGVSSNTTDSAQQGASTETSAPRDENASSADGVNKPLPSDPQTNTAYDTSRQSTSASDTQTSGK